MGNSVSHGYCLKRWEVTALEKNEITLNQLPVGKAARVIALTSNGSERRRILDLGVTESTRVESLFRSPSGNPVAYLFPDAVRDILDHDYGRKCTLFLAGGRVVFTDELAPPAFPRNSRARMALRLAG